MLAGIRRGCFFRNLAHSQHTELPKSPPQQQFSTDSQSVILIVGASALLGLCRDSEQLTSIFNDFESTDGNASHWKYAVSKTNVYRNVYHELNGSVTRFLEGGVSPLPK